MSRSCRSGGSASTALPNPNSISASPLTTVRSLPSPLSSLSSLMSSTSLSTIDSDRAISNISDQILLSVAFLSKAESSPPRTSASLSLASAFSLLIYGDCSKEVLLQFISHSRCNLQKLNLCLPRDLENNHLLAVVEKIRGLASLRLIGCFLVTGEGLKTMVLAMSNKLDELSLINCQVEPGFLTTLGQRFRNLRKLNLSHNVMLVDNEFISMLALCNCLRELKVRGCEGLTNASVISMFKSCKQLESVDITKCPGIEAEAVELLVLNCLRLRKIRVEEGKLSDVSSSWASKKLVDVVV